MSLTKEEVKKIAIIAGLAIIVLAGLMYFFRIPLLLKYYSLKFSPEQIDRCAYACNCHETFAECTDDCNRFIKATKLKLYEDVHNGLFLDCKRIK